MLTNIHEYSSAQGAPYAFGTEDGKTTFIEVEGERVTIDPQDSVRVALDTLLGTGYSVAVSVLEGGLKKRDVVLPKGKAMVTDFKLLDDATRDMLLANAIADLAAVASYDLMMAALEEVAGEEVKAPPAPASPEIDELAVKLHNQLCDCGDIESLDEFESESANYWRDVAKSALDINS